MLHAVAQGRSAGHPTERRADMILRCGTRDQNADAAQVTRDETTRFEGASNPSDESILLAITLPYGHRGLYSDAFGLAVPADDADILCGPATN